MNKAKFLYSLLVIFIFLALPCYADAPDANLHIKCIYPVVQVENSKGGWGTGTILHSLKTDSGYCNVVLTCAHVVDSCTYGHIIKAKYVNWSEFNGNEPIFRFRVFFIDYNKDMALLVFKSDKAMSTADIKFDEKLFIGNQVKTLGFGDTVPVPRLDVGTITAVNLLVSKFSIPIYRASANVTQGDSGGPVIHDYSVIGIRFALIRKPNGNDLNFDSLIIPINVLRDLSNMFDHAFNFIWDKSIKEYPELEYAMLDVPDMKNQDSDGNTDIPPPPPDDPDELD